MAYCQQNWYVQLAIYSDSFTLNKPKKVKEVKFVLQVSYKLCNVVKMKATKGIVLLVALNKLRKRKILFRRKMKNLLLTFALFMQKQDYYYCLVYELQVPQNRKLVAHAWATWKVNFLHIYKVVILFKPFIKTSKWWVIQRIQIKLIRGS